MVYEAVITVLSNLLIFLWHTYYTWQIILQSIQQFFFEGKKIFVSTEKSDQNIFEKIFLFQNHKNQQLFPFRKCFTDEFPWHLIEQIYALLESTSIKVQKTALYNNLLNN